MDNYLALIHDIHTNGIQRNDRTDTGTLSVFGRQLRFDLSENKLPLVTTKQLHFKSILYELLYFISGETNIKLLRDHEVKIWDPWVGYDGEAGRIYGVQWNHWRTYGYGDMEINQLQQALNLLVHTPESRRIIVSAWNVADLDKMVLPPCHLLFQFYTKPIDNKRHSLSCMVTMRSCDVGIGLPYNIASYAILTSMVAQVVGMVPDELVMSLGDAHIYNTHLEALLQQCERKPTHTPLLELNPRITSLWDFKYSDVNVKQYNPHPSIRLPIAV